MTDTNSSAATTAKALLSSLTLNRAEDFCIIAGIDMIDFIPAGMDQALATFDRFVEALPEKLCNPTSFKRIILRNPELVYSLIESSGSSIVKKNVDLNDEIKAASNMLDHQREVHLCDLSTMSKELSLNVERFSIYETGDVDKHEDEDDLPTWQITVYAGKKKITHRIDHFEMSKFFPHSVQVTTNPDPDYDGIDNDISPLDDVEGIADPDDWGDDPV
jgi:hypothetical protein